MSLEKSTKIALFGGSFDPPHLAHRQVVEYLLTQESFDEIWILPAAINPLKDILTPLFQREKMCQLNFADLEARVKVCSNKEFQQTYTVDLIKILQQKYPEAQFSLILGSDLKSQLLQWREYENLQKMVDFYWLPRGGQEHSPFLEASSSKIRKLREQGQDWKKFLLASVAKFVEEEHLYEKNYEKNSK